MKLLTPLLCASALGQFSLPLKNAIKDPHHKQIHGVAPAVGSIFDFGYFVEVEIDGVPFPVLADTGSSELAVISTPTKGCHHVFEGKCDTDTKLLAQYGAGFWSGSPCHGHLKIAGIDAGKVTFAGIVNHSFSYCSDDGVGGLYRVGIMGLAYPALVDGNYTKPAFFSLVEHSGIDPVFAMQCCGWRKGDGDEKHPGSGAIDFGFVNRHHYSGELGYTAVLKEDYYNVKVTAVYVGGDASRDGKSIGKPVWDLESASASSSQDPAALPNASATGAVSDRYRNTPMATIIDSGTRWLDFRYDVYTNVLEQMRHHIGDAVNDMWNAVQHSQPYCLHPSEIKRMKFPDVTVEFEGYGEGAAPVRTTIPPCYYFTPAPSSVCGGPGKYKFVITRAKDMNVFGVPFTEAFYTVYDLSTKPNRVGFAAVAGCSNPILCEELSQGPSVLLGPKEHKKDSSAEDKNKDNSAEDKHKDNSAEDKHKDNSAEDKHKDNAAEDEQKKHGHGDHSPQSLEAVNTAPVAATHRPYATHNPYISVKATHTPNSHTNTDNTDTGTQAPNYERHPSYLFGNDEVVSGITAAAADVNIEHGMYLGSWLFFSLVVAALSVVIMFPRIKAKIMGYQSL